MPSSGPLTELKLRLRAALEPSGALAAPAWGDLRAMTEARKSVERSFDVMGAAPNEATLKSAVMAFCTAGKSGSFNELKHTCYGVTLALDEEGGRLIDSGTLFRKLLKAVDGQQDDGRRYRRCYQALLQSYFAFEPADEAGAAKAAEKNFQELRGYLSDNLSVVARPSTRHGVPTWVLTLIDHKNLLTDSPCDRYVKELRQGKTDQLAGVCDGLGISRESWVWQEVILAYLREICSRADPTFKQAMDNAMDLAGGQLDLKPSAGTARQVMAALVTRYEQATPHPEHARLRDMSVEHIGNPWLKRAAWDAWVQHEPARKMVDGWLKTRLVQDFFEILSQDGLADQRRLDYWLRFVPVIDDMWFVLGDDARRNRSPELRALRQRMEGRERVLTAAPAENNAFVMKIGKLLLIEFGVTGNACYVFEAERFGVSLDRRHLSIHQLKQRAGATRLSHMTQWEPRFDDEICPRIGFSPPSNRRRTLAAAPPPYKPPPSPLTKSAPWPTARTTRKAATEDDLLEFSQWCEQHRISCEDRRAKGGAFWVFAEGNEHPFLASRLSSLGFQRKPGKGYWLETED